MRHHCVVTVVVWAVLSVCLAGCGVSATETHEHETIEQVAEEAIYDAKGNRYVLVGDADFDDGPILVQYDEDDDPDPSALTVEELAELIRPIVLWEGKEYILEDPDYDLAAAIKEGTTTTISASPNSGRWEEKNGKKTPSMKMRTTSMLSTIRHRSAPWS